MKLNLKRFLSAVLVAALLIGLSAAASAAVPAGTPLSAVPRSTKSQLQVNYTLQDSGMTGQITQLPDNTSFLRYHEYPDLTGLEFEVSGGVFDGLQQFCYDDILNPTYKMDAVVWEYDIYQKNYDGEGSYWKLGPNDAILCLYGYQAVEFQVVKEVDGVEYGYFEWAYIGYLELELEIYAIAYMPWEYGLAEELQLDQSVDVEFTEDGYQLYSFTAQEAGYYSFKSEGGQIGEALYTIDGKPRVIETIDPYAELIDIDGWYISYDDDRGGNYNFAIFYHMNAGETVYLFTSMYGWNRTDSRYSVKVSTYEPVLDLPTKNIALNFHEILKIDDLLKGTELTVQDVSVDYYTNYFGGVYDYELENYWLYPNLVALSAGSTVIYVTTTDGAQAEVRVTIGYTSAQKFCNTLLLGKYWLSYTPVGLTGGVFALMRSGLPRAFYDLFYYTLDWPDWAVNWLTRFF